MRFATLPGAIAIERAPIVDGVIGEGELLSLGPPRPHVDLGVASAIYVRDGSSGKPPAVCVEQTDRLFRFIFTTTVLAQHWADEFALMANMERATARRAPGDFVPVRRA